MNRITGSARRRQPGIAVLALAVAARWQASRVGRPSIDATMCSMTTRHFYAQHAPAASLHNPGWAPWCGSGAPLRDIAAGRCSYLHCGKPNQGVRSHLIIGMRAALSQGAVAWCGFFPRPVYGARQLSRLSYPDPLSVRCEGLREVKTRTGSRNSLHVVALDTYASKSSNEWGCWARRRAWRRRPCHPAVLH